MFPPKDDVSKPSGLKTASLCNAGTILMRTPAAPGERVTTLLVPNASPPVHGEARGTTSSFGPRFTIRFGKHNGVDTPRMFCIFLPRNPAMLPLTRTAEFLAAAISAVVVLPVRTV